MSTNTLAHRVARVAVRPLLGTAVKPNHLTALRLATGLAAFAAFAHGGAAAVSWGGTLFLFSAFLDQADGEFARIAKLTSPAGHRFDFIADTFATALAFAGIGLGLWRTLDAPVWALLGVWSSIVVALNFLLMMRSEAMGLEVVPSAGPVDADDALLIVAPTAWLGLLEPLLVTSAIGAPAFTVWVGARMLGSRSPRRNSSGGGASSGSRPPTDVTGS